MPRRQTSLPSDLVLDLYKIAVEEYRFEVRLGWDRMTQFLTLQSAVVAAAAALLQLAASGSRATPIVVVPLLIGGMAISFIGAVSTERQHWYFRRTVHKKTLFEDLLGLWEPVTDSVTGASRPGEHLAIATTESMGRGREILDQPNRWLTDMPLRRWTLVYYGLWVLRGFSIAELVTIAYILFRIGIPSLP